MKQQVDWQSRDDQIWLDITRQPRLRPSGTAVQYGAGLLDTQHHHESERRSGVLEYKSSRSCVSSKHSAIYYNVLYRGPTTAHKKVVSEYIEMET